MKEKDLPQDASKLVSMTRELCYVKDKEGKYITKLSTGWQPKTKALESAWDDVKDRINNALIEVKKGKKSPVYFFMEKNLMDIKILSGYTDISKWRIKKHFKPNVFKKLSEKQLKKYAEAFKISVTDLREFKA